MIISHVKIIAFQTIINHSFWTFYIGRKTVVYIKNRKIDGFLLFLEIPDLFRVLNMIFLTRSLSLLVRYHTQPSNKSGIFAHHVLFFI